MGNEHTKEQIRSFLEKAIEKAKNPNDRERLKRLRQARAEKVSKRYGF
jgi:uncharacterized membrane protein (DUF106 family)